MTGAHETILVVDDDRALASALGGFLESEAYDVILAHSGKEALEALEGRTIPLVLQDLRLPDIDGTVLLERIRHRESPPDVVILTAHASVDTAVGAIDAAVSGYLVKPVDLARLRAVVASVLERRRLGEQTQRDAHAQQRRLSRLDALLPITQALGGTRDLEPLSMAAAKTAEALGIEHCVFHVWRDEQLIPAAGNGDGTVTASAWLCVQASLEEVPAYAEAIESRSPVAVEDTAAAPDLVPPGWAEASGFRALLVVPLLRDTELVGTMTLADTREARVWAPDLVELATTIAGQVAVALGGLHEFDDALMQRVCLTQLLDSASDGIMLIDRQGHITSANRRAGVLLAFSPERVVGFGLLDLLAAHFPAGETYDQIEASFQALLADPEPGGQGELELPLLKRTLHWIAQPMRLPSGAIVASTVTWRDVTHEREVDRMKSEFISMVSHQLRTPLTGIRWMLDAAANHADSLDEAKEYARDAEASVVRLVRLVNELLDIARLESGRLTVSEEAVGLKSLTEAVVDELRGLVSGKQQHLVLDLADVGARADAQLLRQVVLNLTSNAIKYTPAGGRIVIGTSRDGDAAVWTVTDTGIGIPRPALARLFERFFRAPNATATAEGTGLGLYLVRLVVERLGGTVACDSEEGRGSTFTVRLPLAAADEPAAT